jgi:pimeloyl-ACP methyl ester carboxylesterase
MKKPQLIETVPVAGGNYTVARWPGDDAKAILAVHGITASHCAWPPVVDNLKGGYTVLAPDLRGRGASSELPAPYGLKVHAADLLAVLDHYGIEQCVCAGHSLGAYIALELALLAPGRLRGLVLVDGGIALPPREGVSKEQVIKGVLGPALARLDMRFESAEAYADFWRKHPAFQDEGAWNTYVESYVAYDLIGAAPQLRSRVNAEAVAADASDLQEPEIVTLIDSVDLPMILLTAPRGIMNQPQPLMPPAAVAEKCAKLANLRHIDLPDTNHYSIMTGSGRLQVAKEIDAFIAGL